MDGEAVVGDPHHPAVIKREETPLDPLSIWRRSLNGTPEVSNLLHSFVLVEFLVKNGSRFAKDTYNS